MSLTSIDQRINIFRHTRLLCEARTDTLAKLAEQATEQAVQSNETIITQGDDTNDIYFIVEGDLLVKTGQHTIQSLKKGDVFGLYPLADYKGRSANIIADTKSLLVKLKAEAYYAAAEKDLSLIKGLAREISENTRNLIQLHDTIASQRDEIEKQRAELAELNQTKDKLFSIMGHDLRSPVASIITLIEILLSDLGNMNHKEIRELLNDISQLSQIHIKLLENLLQWARLQTGALQCHPDNYLLSEIIRDTIPICEYRFKAKDIKFVQELEYQTTVFVDNNMIQTVIRNLITNAGKFTRRGGAITLKSEKLDDYEVQVSVSDTGIGMSQQQLAQLFKLDKLQSRYGTENEAGTGLGLIICRDFVQKNNGRIWATSSENEGSTFFFTLPISQH